MAAERGDGGGPITGGSTNYSIEAVQDEFQKLKSSAEGEITQTNIQVIMGSAVAFIGMLCDTTLGIRSREDATSIRERQES